MEKQKTGLRQASQWQMNASFRGAPARGESSMHLSHDNSKRRLVAKSSAVSLTEEAATMVPVTASGAFQSTFDPLELLGPSLLEVLTLVSPPQPRAQREQTGEDTHNDSDGSPSETQDNNIKLSLSLSRSVILGKVVDPSGDNARKTQDYFAKMLDRLQCEATGMLLLQDTTIVIFLETSADHFLEICRQLLTQHVLEASSLKVLASCDAHAMRLLQGLYVKKIALTARFSSEDWSPETVRQNAVNTFLNLVKFMKRIGPMQPTELRKCLTNLSNTDQTFLPSNELVLWLLAQEELMTLEEFLSTFDDPIFIELESERVWPVHPLLQY